MPVGYKKVHIESLVEHSFVVAMNNLDLWMDMKVRAASESRLFELGGDTAHYILAGNSPGTYHCNLRYLPVVAQRNIAVPDILGKYLDKFGVMAHMLHFDGSNTGPRIGHCHSRKRESLGNCEDWALA